MTPLEPGDAPRTRRWFLPGFRVWLYVATLPVVLLSVLFSWGALAGDDDPAILVYFGPALILYGALALFAGKLARSPSRRSWMFAYAVVAACFAVLGSWDTALFMIFLPSCVMFQLLGWLG
jgi:hypothetical protein